MERKDKIAIWISGVALIIAIFSLLLAWKAYRIDKISFNKENTEDLYLKVSWHHESYDTQINRGFGELFPATIPLRWNLMIGNNGKIPISVTRTKIIQIARNYPIDYSGIGILTTDGKTPIDYPLNIPPGETKEIVIVVSVLINADIYKTIESKYPIDTKVSRRSLMRHLARQGIDLYGNELSLREFEDGNMMITHQAKKENLQIFQLKIETTRNSDKIINFSEYEHFESMINDIKE